MPDELRPILRSGTAEIIKPQRGQLFAKTIRFAAGLASLAGVLTSAYYFMGFAENDPYFLHLLSAFALCFGIGALFYLPTFFIVRKAHIYINKGPRPKQARQVIAVILPWPFLAFYFAPLGGYWTLFAGIILALTLLCGSWAIYLFKSEK